MPLEEADEESDKVVEELADEVTTVGTWTMIFSLLWGCTKLDAYCRRSSHVLRQQGLAADVAHNSCTSKD